MDELEQMREQLNLLKSQLDKEEIVNEKLFREVTNTRVKKLNRNIWQMGICALFVITFGSWSFRNMGLSWWFVAATILMMIVCFLATVIPHSWVKQNDIINGKLIDVTKQVMRLKQLYIDWQKIGIVTIIIWGAWLATELYFISQDIRLFLFTLLPLVVGGVIGGIIGRKCNKKLIAEMDNIIKSIEEYTDESKQ